MSDYLDISKSVAKDLRADSKAADQRVSQPTEKYLKALARSESVKDYRRAIRAANRKARDGKA